MWSLRRLTAEEVGSNREGLFKKKIVLDQASKENDV